MKSNLMRKRIERGIVKSHWLIFALVILGVIGFGIFKYEHHKSAALPEVELCEILYQMD